MKMKLLYLGNQLSKHGFNKTTIDTLSVQLQTLGFTVYCASDKRNAVLRLFRMILAIFKYRNTVSYLIIDTYSTSAFWYAFICSQLARFFKIRYLPILHGGNLPNRLKNNPRISKMIFDNAYQNVAPSNYLKSIFEREGFTNVVLLPNSIEIEKYVYKERAQLAPKLLWVRAFASIYNPEMAVEVMVLLKQKYPDAMLTMVGPDKDGSLQKTKDLANRLGVSISFTGQLEKEVWWELAQEHDIFINTSHFDNTPVSIMEAMAMGLVVVSTNVGGIPFLLTHQKNAFLVDDGNSVQMAEAIDFLITHGDVAKKNQKSAREFVSQMDWDKIKEKWEVLFK